MGIVICIIPARNAMHILTIWKAIYLIPVRNVATSLVNFQQLDSRIVATFFPQVFLQFAIERHICQNFGYVKWYSSPAILTQLRYYFRDCSWLVKERVVD